MYHSKNSVKFWNHLMAALLFLGISCQLAPSPQASTSSKGKGNAVEEEVDRASVHNLKGCVPLAIKDQSKKTATRLCSTMGSFREAAEKGVAVSSMLTTAAQQTRGVLDDDGAREKMGLCFSYVGDSKEMKALKSGAMRKQIGLKLKAQDSCNLIYVMWRFYPENQIVVSSKVNQSKHTHKECGNEGYKTIKSIPMSTAIKEGDYHSLKVQLAGNELEVVADERPIWKGTLDKELEGLKGPLGIRTDNGNFLFRLDDWGDTSRNCHISSL